MKVLWITGSLTYDIRERLGLGRAYPGGWISAGSCRLVKENEIELAIAVGYGKKFEKLTHNGITYFFFPQNIRNIGKYNPKHEVWWNVVNEEFKPDVVHIFGTEFPFGLGYIRTCGVERVIISVQGLISIITRHFFGGIPIKEFLINLTIGDLLFKNSFIFRWIEMRGRGKYEKEYLEKVNFFEGRTKWDMSVIWSVNPSMRYFSCDRFLRPTFYVNEWELSKCDRHTIFITTAKSPFKGAHQVFKALPLILREFPDTMIYIAGGKIFDKSSFKKKILYTGYSKYLFALAKRLKILNHICFTGVLYEEEFCLRLLKSHVFISPSSIDNAPNSLAEAQILGVPSVASSVGGVPDMVNNGTTGLLYRFEDVEVLARHICDIFRNDDLAMHISKNERKMALQRHDLDNIVLKLMKIYDLISHSR